MTKELVYLSKISLKDRHGRWYGWAGRLRVGRTALNVKNTYHIPHTHSGCSSQGAKLVSNKRTTRRVSYASHAQQPCKLRGSVAWTLDGPSERCFVCFMLLLIGYRLKTVVLRGTILNRTYGTDKKLCSLILL